MKKKIASLLLVFAMLCNIFLLAGCGGGDTETFLEPPTVEIPESGYDGSAVTITFYHTMGSNLRDVLDKYIAKFNEVYPNITIEHTQVGSYDDVRDTISTEIAVGAGPNIAYCYPDHVALYRRANKVVALDTFINSTVSDGAGGILGLTEEQIDNFIDGYYAEGYQFDDGSRMYTLPLSKSTEVLYYNKTFFDGCVRIYNSEILIDMDGNPIYVTDDEGNVVTDGEGNPQTQVNPNYHNENYNLYVPTTWDEMEEICAKIKAIDPTCVPLGYDSEANWFITMCEQMGSGYTSSTKVNGSNFLFDNETNREFIKEFNDWYNKGYVTTQEIYGAYTSGLFTAIGDNVQKSYMSIGSSAGATHQRPTAGADGSYPFEVGITTVPQIDAENPKVISQGPSVCIFDKENDMEVIASWLFVKYLTTTVEFQAAFSIASGYVPVLENVAENASYAAFLENADGGDFIAALSAKVCLEQADAYYTSPAFVGSSTARDEVGVLLRKCISYEGEDLDAYIKKAFKDAIDACKYMAR